MQLSLFLVCLHILFPLLGMSFFFFSLTSKASSNIIFHGSFWMLATFIWPLLCNTERGRPCMSLFYKDLIGLYWLYYHYLSVWLSLSQRDVLFLEGRDYLLISIPKDLIQWLLQQIPNNSWTNELGITIYNLWCWYLWLLFYMEASIFQNNVTIWILVRRIKRLAGILMSFIRNSM